jgi:cell division protein FtsB
MMKIIASVASGALAVGGAGYSYVTKVQTESAAVRAENASLQQTVAAKESTIKDQNATMDQIVDLVRKARGKNGV